MRQSSGRILVWAYTIWLDGQIYISWTIYSLCDFFTQALACGHSVESETEHISSVLQDSSQYFVQSHQCCCMNSLDPSSNFRPFYKPFQAHQLRSLIPSCSADLFCPLERSIYFVIFSLYFIINLFFTGSHNWLDGKFSFLLIITRSDILADIRWYVCISKSHRILYISFRRDFGLCLIPFL